MLYEHQDIAPCEQGKVSEDLRGPRENRPRGRQWAQGKSRAQDRATLTLGASGGRACARCQGRPQAAAARAGLKHIYIVRSEHKVPADQSMAVVRGAAAGPAAALTGRRLLLHM